MRFESLSNDELFSSLTGVVANEREHGANVIRMLVEVEARQMHLERACSSMFVFCTKQLGYSEGQAYRRLIGAQLASRFPVLLDALAAGRIHLASIVLLRRQFTETNVDALVAAASGKTKKEVQRLIAGLAPKPDVPTEVRALPRRANDAVLDQAEGGSSGKAVRTDELVPLAPSRYKVTFTADEALHAKFERAQALMRHQNPSGDLVLIVSAAMDLLVEALEKRVLAKTERPRASKPSKDPGHVNRATRREVVEREGEQCAYVAPSGERCSSREFLEIDHRIARAHGGKGDASNVRLLCRAHNRYMAEKTFGRALVTQKIRLRQSKSAAAKMHRAVTRIAARGQARAPRAAQATSRDGPVLLGPRPSS